MSTFLLTESRRHSPALVYAGRSADVRDHRAQPNSIHSLEEIAQNAVQLSPGTAVVFTNRSRAEEFLELRRRGHQTGAHPCDAFDEEEHEYAVHEYHEQATAQRDRTAASTQRRGRVWEAHELHAMDFLRWLLTAHDAGIEQFVINPGCELSSDAVSPAADAQAAAEYFAAQAVSIDEILAGLAEQVTTAVTEHRLAHQD